MHTHRFLVKGGKKLQGVVQAGGSKNAALPIIAASLLTDEPVILHNVPDIADIATMEHILHFLGVEIFSGGRRLNKRNWKRIFERCDLLNVSSYGGLVRQHSNLKKVKYFNWWIKKLIE